MSELIDVLSAIEGLHLRGEGAWRWPRSSACAAPHRRPGVRLLVPEHGASIGNSSGGCLEGDVKRIGREVMIAGAPRIELFDLTAEGDEVWD